MPDQVPPDRLLSDSELVAMIDAETVQQCCMEIVHVNRVFGYIIPKVVCFTIGYPRLYSTSSHP